jgi:SPP1 gp7 family putative phage head morphogenesis protein
VNLRQRLILAYAAAGHRPRKGPPCVKPKPPNAAERAYVAALRGLVRKAHAEVLAAVAKEKPAIEQAARLDAMGDLPARIRDALANAFGDAATAYIAQQAWRRINAHSLADTAAVLGVNPNLLDPEATAQWHAWRTENVGLIRDLADDYRRQIEEQVAESLQAGERWEALRDRLVDRYGVAQSRAELIAVDQTLKANADLARVRAQRVGVTSYVWSTSKDERVRPDHAKLDGNTYTYADPPIVDARTGRREPPGRDYRCRCVALPVLDD